MLVRRVIVVGGSAIAISRNSPTIVLTLSLRSAGGLPSESEERGAGQRKSIEVEPCAVNLSAASRVSGAAIGRARSRAEGWYKPKPLPKA